MKKLSEIKIKDVSILSENEMKQVYGGSGTGGESQVTSCSTSCGSGGDSIEITDCHGTCSAVDGVSVTCSGTKNTLTKNC